MGLVHPGKDYPSSLWGTGAFCHTPFAERLGSLECFEAEHFGSIPLYLLTSTLENLGLSLEEDDEDLSPGPEHSSDSEYTLSEPDSEEEGEEEVEEEEATDDPEYDPGYKKLGN
ncbi:Zinc finger protein 428 [Manis javanica]|nr:Zinc finger protein 428 [Manis javanica]